MKMLIKTSVLIATLSSMLLALQAFAGGMHTGGGCALFPRGGNNEGTGFFLDLVQDGKVPLTAQRGPAFRSNGMLGEVEFEPANLKELASYNLLSRRIQAWSSVAPQAGEWFRVALHGFTPRFMSTAVGAAASPCPRSEAASAKGSEPVHAAIYVADTGAFIDVDIWNQLSLESQAALLLHEAVRHLQITHGRSVDEASLAKLVNEIVTSKTEHPLDLKDFGTLLGRPPVPEALTDQACALYQGLSSVTIPGGQSASIFTNWKVFCETVDWNKRHCEADTPTGMCSPLWAFSAELKRFDAAVTAEQRKLESEMSGDGNNNGETYLRYYRAWEKIYSFEGELSRLIAKVNAGAFVDTTHESPFVGLADGVHRLDDPFLLAESRLAAHFQGKYPLDSNQLGATVRIVRMRIQSLEQEGILRR